MAARGTELEQERLFRELCVGGVRFNKKKSKADIEKFKSKPIIAPYGTEDRTDSKVGLASSSDKSRVVPSQANSHGSSRDVIDTTSDDELVDVSEDDEANEDIMILPGISTPQNSSGHKSSKKATQAASKAKVKKKSGTLKKLGLKVLGDDVPPLLGSFEGIKNIPIALVSNLKTMGIVNPSPIQRQAIPIILDDREILGIAPTGSGKTASYVVPILVSLLRSQPLTQPNHEIRCLLLAPTRELAHQLYRETIQMANGLPLKVLMLTKVSARVFLKSKKEEFTGVDILVSTPARVSKLIDDEKSGMRPHTFAPTELARDIYDTFLLEFSLANASYLIFDEADKLFEAEFREQMDVVVTACSNPKVQRGLFSATLPPQVEELARTFLKDPIRVLVGAKNAATETIEQKLHFVGREDGKLLALKQMIETGSLPLPCLVFVQSKDRANELYRELEFDKINVDVITAERPQPQRDRIVQEVREGKIWVLISTDLMARGMDFKGISCVINFDFPTSINQYIHRIGRTGRAGLRGTAITFFTEDDKESLRTIANVVKQSGGDVPDWMLALPKLSKNSKKRLEKRPISRRRIGPKAGVGRKYPKRKRGEGDSETSSKKRRSDI